MDPQKYIFAHKHDLILLIKNAVTTLNRERKSKYSMHNLAQDFKDNLNQDFPEFCNNNDFNYVRNGLSQKIIINGICIKIKIHNNLCKYKRSLIDKEEAFTNQLHLFEITTENTISCKTDWELGIELSKNRDKLLYVRLADFINKKIIPIYSYSNDNIEIGKSKELQSVEKNHIKTKVINIQKKEKIENGI